MVDLRRLDPPWDDWHDSRLAALDAADDDAASAVASVSYLSDSSILLLCRLEPPSPLS